MKIKTRSYTKTNGHFVYITKITCGRQSRSQCPPIDNDAVYADHIIGAINKPTTNTVYMVAVTSYVGCNTNRNTSDSLIFVDDNGHGFRGNSDHNNKRYHGWRGTTNDVAIHAMGVRRCLSVTVSGNRSKTLRIEFGKDIKPNED